MFAIVSWVQVMIGQGILPQGHHPMVELMPEHDLRQFVSSVRQVIASCVDAMPAHEAFIARHCAAPSLAG
jgi:tryptophan 7-halogenase